MVNRERLRTDGNAAVTFCGPCFSTAGAGTNRHSEWGQPTGRGRLRPARRPETSPWLKIHASLPASDNDASASLDGGLRSSLLYGQSLPEEETTMLCLLILAILF